MSLVDERVRPDPLVVQRQNQLFDLYAKFVDGHADETDYDPDDDPDFVAQARETMGLPPDEQAVRAAGQDDDE